MDDHTTAYKCIWPLYYVWIFAHITSQFCRVLIEAHHACFTTPENHGDRRLKVPVALIPALLKRFFSDVPLFDVILMES